MGRPPVKSTRALVKAKLVAEAKFMNSNIGREVWLRQQVEKLIDKIDPLELVSTVMGAFVVYDLIKSTPELVAQAKVTTLIAISPILAVIVDKLLGGLAISQEQSEELARIRDTPDFMLFVKSFVISYLMIKHSGQIINGVGNLTGFIAGMLGMKAV